MKLGYGMKLEQVQKLAMTPELRQAIEILQYNSMELNQHISDELEQNPILEIDSSTSDIEMISIETHEESVDWKEYFERYDDISYKGEKDKNVESSNLEAYTSYSPKLKDHLLSQLNLVYLDEKQFKIGEYIIFNIDDNGYLRATTEEMTSIFNEKYDEVENIVKLIQSFDPSGIAARDLKECLLLQLKDKGPDPIVEQIIENNLQDVANNRLHKIAKEYDIDIERLNNICSFIKTLEPKPGRLFDGDSGNTKYILPDAVIREVDGEYIIIINDFTAPKLYINDTYRNMLKDGGDIQTLEYLQGRYNKAMWLIKSIEQRRQTIQKVLESILKYQLEFFKKGKMALKPLTLKDIAGDIEMNESTISRTTNGKYVQTPRGLFEFKYFFTNSITSSQGDISSVGVKLKLKEIIEGENPKKPLSDQAISTLLEVDGIKISRRTVAKYRDELDIPASSIRKEY